MFLLIQSIQKFARLLQLAFKDLTSEDISSSNLTLITKDLSMLLIQLDLYLKGYIQTIIATI